MTDYDDMEAKKDDLPTGQLEAGNAGGYVDEAHPQLDGKYMAKFDDQSTLDLSPDNLEKAYREFKAEQLEKMAYEAVKGKFQKRFEAEMVTKEAEIVKSSYDAQSEVAELKQQFSDLLKSLKNEKTAVIRKHEEAVEALNIPSPDTIAKMDWSEINQLVNRLENGA
jgi:bisphosphoglycerate-dependent phosphoglycerate mutase